MNKIWGIHKWDILKLTCGSIFIDTEQTSGYISKQTSGCETNCMSEMPPVLLKKKKKKNIYGHLYNRVLKHRPQKYTPMSYF